MKLLLELEREQVSRGERVEGRVEVLEGGPSRSLMVTVSLHEQTNDYGANPFSSDVALHEGELVRGQVFTFDFALPLEAPPSIKGEHSELKWEVSAKSDEPGLDSHVSRPLIVT